MLLRPTSVLFNWNAVNLNTSDIAWCAFSFELVLPCNLNFQVVGNVVPAAAVTPQPLVYTNIAAVKRLVVGLKHYNNLHSLCLCTVLLKH